METNIERTWPKIDLTTPLRLGGRALALAVVVAVMWIMAQIDFNHHGKNDCSSMTRAQVLTEAQLCPPRHLTEEILRWVQPPT